MAQLYDCIQTKNTISFANELEKRLPSKYGVEVIRRSKAAEISRDKPVLVMCQNHRSIAADIRDATIHLQDIPVEMVAVIIIHAKAANNLPKVMTSDKIEDDTCNKFGLLVDFGYLEQKLYDCDMNTLGDKKMKVFLDKHFRDEVPMTLTCCSGSATQKQRNVTGQHKPYKIQFYAEPEMEAQKKLLFTEEFKVVTSFEKLRWKTLCIVVCKAGSSVEHDTYSADSTNGKILITSTEKDTPDTLRKTEADTSRKTELNLSEGIDTPITLTNTETFLHILVKMFRSNMVEVKETVMRFIRTFTVKVAKSTFEKNENENVWIEIFKEKGAANMTKIDELLENVPCRRVSLITDFTKDDPRILRLVVCDNEMAERLEQESPTNATVVCVFIDNKSGFEIARNKNLLLKVTFGNDGQLSSDFIKNELVIFMHSVLSSFLDEQVTKLFSNDWKKSQRKCHIL